MAKVARQTAILATSRINPCLTAAPVGATVRALILHRCDPMDIRLLQIIYSEETLRKRDPGFEMLDNIICN